MSSASDSRSLQPLPTPDAAAEPTVCVLKVGAEGGSIRLLARPQAKGPWEYAVTTEETPLQDPPPTASHQRRERPMRWVADWQEALRLLDQYPWPTFPPLHLDLGFREPVLEAVLPRLERLSMPEEIRNSRIKDWSGAWRGNASWI